MITYRVELKRYKQFRNILTRVDVSKDKVALDRLRSLTKETVHNSWKEAIRKTGIRRRTGQLEDMFVFRDRGGLKFTAEFTAPHAKFQYYGTRASRGRYLPYIYKRGQKIKLEKRFSKKRLRENIEKYGEKFVGWHPGVKNRIGKRFPLVLRRNMNKMIERFIVWLGDRII